MDDEFVDKLQCAFEPGPVEFELEDVALWRRCYERALVDFARTARRQIPRLGRLAPPGDIELPVNHAEIRRQAIAHADLYVAHYRGLIDGGYWCRKDRTDDLKGYP